MLPRDHRPAFQGGLPPFTLRAGWVIAALLGAFSLLFGWQSWRVVKDDQIQQLETVAGLAERAVDRYFVQLGQSLAVLEERILDGDGDFLPLPTVQRLLSDFKERQPELLTVSLLGLDGQFLATSSTPSLDGLPTVGDRRDFAAIVARQRPEERFEIAPPLLGPASNRWILPVRYAVRSRQGQLLGFLVASAPVGMLQTFWSDAPIVSKAAIALVRDDGYLLSRYPLPAGMDPASVYGKPRDGVVMRYLRDNGFPAKGYVEGVLSLVGGSFATVFVRLQHHQITLLASIPMSQLWGLWLERTAAAYILAIGLGIAGLGAYRHLVARELAWRHEQHRVAAELRDSNAFLERAGRVAGVGGWAVDLRTQQLVWSPRTRQIHAVDDDYQPTLETAIAFYAVEARPIIEAAVLRGIQEGTPWDLELRLISATGREVWVRAHGEVEFDGRDPIRLVGAFQDITEYRRRRIELANEQALREQAELHATALDRLLNERGRMLDVLAHEVRQPLNNACAALQAARAALMDDAAAEPARPVRQAQVVLRNVLTSIDNTLAAAVLLAGDTPLRREDTEVDLLLELCRADLLEEQQARVVIDRQTATRTVGMDSALMRLALRNVLTNALSYSAPHEQVVVRLSDSDQPAAFVFEVMDRGTGVSGDLGKRLFTRGARCTSSQGQAGMGLGLHIVRRVLDLHGGTIDLIPRDGGGTIARLVLPQVE